MNEKINYKELLPTYGNHRPLWPKYGEYRSVNALAKFPIRIQLKNLLPNAFNSKKSFDNSVEKHQLFSTI